MTEKRSTGSVIGIKCKHTIGDAWIYSLTKNEWIPFKNKYSDKSRLCLETVISFKEMLAGSLDFLPKHLLHHVHQRFASNNTCGS
ncbi:kelch domain-containing protein 2-like [Ascaphus truei]|uniref:kelch domain-containing protein 2-like n=1 Tax=Ascaphus truei TaxID=8439 RepID=UPI003F590FDE